MCKPALPETHSFDGGRITGAVHAVRLQASAQSQRRPATRRPSSRAENISPRPATASPATRRRAASCSRAAAPCRRRSARCIPRTSRPIADTGIGKWTADQFYSMMHTGRFPDGGLLYPAMPFGSYTKITRADSDAIFAFMQSVPPVKLQNKPHDLRFPYNNRSLIIGWRTLFFTEGEYKPDATKSDEWNRGAYLVQGLGHCAMCHSAINALGGSSESAAFEGGLIPMQNWYAPSLTSSKEGGLGDWSIEDISDLLRTGISKRGAVYGPMADVTYNSLQYMTEADTRAMAVYLKSLAEHSVPDAPRSTTSAQESSLLLRLGQTIYADKCASCHGDKGQGKLSALSAARRQSIDRDVVGRQSDPHGPQWRLSAGHGGQSDAARNAAVRPIALGRRSRGGRDLHPHFLGQSRSRGFRSEANALRSAPLQ